jgi:hypothetical protein
LQQGNREVFDRHSRHEDSEVWMHLFLLKEFLHDALDFRQDADREMAVLKENPIAFFGALF